MPAPPSPSAWSATVDFAKVETAKRQVFGWLYVARDKSGAQVVDHSGETISVEELEKASYNFVLGARVAGENHTKANGKVAGVGRLIECVVFTPEKRAAMGIPEGHVPDGTWVGFKIDSDAAWQGVVSGRYKMLSLGGKAIKSALEE
jgi:hypothetical protein